MSSMSESKQNKPPAGEKQYSNEYKDIPDIENVLMELQKSFSQVGERTVKNPENAAHAMVEGQVAIRFYLTASDALQLHKAGSLTMNLQGTVVVNLGDEAVIEDEAVVEPVELEVQGDSSNC